MAVFNLYPTAEIDDPRVSITKESRNRCTRYISRTAEEYKELECGWMDVPWDGIAQNRFIETRKDREWGDLEKCADYITWRNQKFQPAGSFKVFISLDEEARTVAYDEVVREYSVKLETPEEMLQFMNIHNLHPSWEGLTDQD